jgi:hypothetical protein
MSTKLKHQDKPQGQQPQTGAPKGGNVLAMPSRCASEGCSKKTEVQTFCKEHFDWFKFGLITKEGKKPIDFDKKMVAFMKHKHAA